jgi:hypothetical protein
MPRIRYIRYDEKNRSQIIRRHITYPPAIGCRVCGGFNGIGGLYEFGIMHDKMKESHAYWIGLYCSLKCFDGRLTFDTECDRVNP